MKYKIVLFIAVIFALGVFLGRNCLRTYPKGYFLKSVSMYEVSLPGLKTSDSALASDYNYYMLTFSFKDTIYGVFSKAYHLGFINRKGNKEKGCVRSIKFVDNDGKDMSSQVVCTKFVDCLPYSLIYVDSPDAKLTRGGMPCRMLANMGDLGYYINNVGDKISKESYIKWDSLHTVSTLIGVKKSYPKPSRMKIETSDGVLVGRRSPNTLEMKLIFLVPYGTTKNWLSQN